MSFMCLEENNGKAVVTIVTDVSNCLGYIAEESLTYQTQPTLYDLFNIPLAADLNQAFMIGLYIPLLAYLVSWSYGVLINWFAKPEDNS